MMKIVATISVVCAKVVETWSTSVEVGKLCSMFMFCFYIYRDNAISGSRHYSDYSKTPFLGSLCRKTLPIGQLSNIKGLATFRVFGSTPNSTGNWALLAPFAGPVTTTKAWTVGGSQP